MSKAIVGLLTLLLSPMAVANTLNGGNYDLIFSDNDFYFDGTSFIKNYNYSGSYISNNDSTLNDIFSDNFSIIFSPHDGYFIKSFSMEFYGSVTPIATLNPTSGSFRVILQTDAYWVSSIKFLNASYVPEQIPIIRDFDSSVSWSIIHSVWMPEQLNVRLGGNGIGTNTAFNYQVDSFSIRVVAAPVPELQAYSMLLLGLLGLCIYPRKKAKYNLWGQSKI